MSIFKVTLFVLIHAIGHNHIRASISLSLHASVPSRNQESLPPSHYHTLPPTAPSLPCHATTYRNCVAVRPGATPLHQRATVTPACKLVHRRTTVPPGAPPCHLVFHHAAVPPCRRLTETTHRHTYIHPRT